MITAEMEVETGIDVDLDDDSDEYEYVYPPELIQQWVKDFDEMKIAIAKGELKPQTVEELAAELGIVMD